MATPACHTDSAYLKHDSAGKFGHKIVNEKITDIALIVPDEWFWFGKQAEQNSNESIWQTGFMNLVTYKQSHWAKQSDRYEKAEVKAKKIVLNALK